MSTEAPPMEKQPPRLSCYVHAIEHCHCICMNCLHLPLSLRLCTITRHRMNYKIQLRAWTVIAASVIPELLAFSLLPGSMNSPEQGFTALAQTQIQEDPVEEVITPAPHTSHSSLADDSEWKLVNLLSLGYSALISSIYLG